MKKSLLAIPVSAAAVALCLSGCAQAPGTATTSAGTSSGGAVSASNFTACMVSDSGGFDDKSFNETSYNGLKQAATDLHIQQKAVQSVTTDDYAKNVQSMVAANCNIIIGVGYNLQDAITQSAQANPNIKYALVDSGPTTPLPNAKGLVFNTNEAAFLGGYLAAGISKSGVVGTFGGQQIPSVTIYMDGFYDGVQYYNQQNGTSVKVLGWDETTQQGQFVQSNNPFADPTAGAAAANAQITQGADVIFPVAGNSGTGALTAAQGTNGAASAIWVDTDGCESAAQYCAIMPTSVYKGMDVAVEQVIKDTLNGQFTSANYIGDLANGGVGISDFHDWDSKIPDQLKSDLNTIKQGIIAGTITADSPSINK